MLKSIGMAIDLRKRAKDKYLAAYGEFEKQQSIYKRILLNSEKTREGKERVSLNNLAAYSDLFASFFRLFGAEMAAKEYKLRKAQQLVESCLSELESITSQLIEEFNTFKKQRSQEIKTVLLNFVKMQAGIYFCASVSRLQLSCVILNCCYVTADALPWGSGESLGGLVDRYRGRGCSAAQSGGPRPVRRHSLQRRRRAVCRHHSLWLV